MIPAGYLPKRICAAPGWFETKQSHIKDICSVSDCVNDNVVDPQKAWLHNSFGLANSPEILASLAIDSGADVEEAILFYYTAYEFELDSDGWIFDASRWQARSPAASPTLSDAVRPPAKSTLIGYDVVVFGDFLEHSPLSCNSVADQLPVNEHCLLNTLEEAVDAINSGAFGGSCEDGAYTIFAVNLVQ